MKTGVSYYGCRIPWRAKEDLKEIKRNHCNFVVHTFSEEDKEFYVEAMREIVRDSHELGLEVWIDPWGVGQAFGGETHSALVAKNLGVRQISAKGVSLPIACINHPDFRNYLFEWADVAAEIGSDVFFWDEPHFYIFREDLGPPEDWACRCSHCQALYKKRFNEEMPKELTESVKQFKEESLLDFLKVLCDKGRELGKKNAMCYLPFESTSNFTHWEKVGEIENVDIIGTDPYWRETETDVAGYVGKAAQRIAKIAKAYKKEGQIWILNFRLKSGQEGQVTEAVKAAADAGIRNIAAWSYYGAAYISLAAEDPKAVWETLGSAYKKLRSQA